jgi:putative transposase
MSLPATHAHCRRSDRERLLRRVRGALSALFRDGVSKDIVSRAWRKIKSDWDAWNVRSLADEPMVRLILDGTVVRVRQRMRR